MKTRAICVALIAGFGLVLGGCPVDPTVNNNWTDGALDRNDDDGDGFSEAQGDCDDTNANIHPDAREIVDAIDNNCDGLIDDDLDGDGFPAAEDCDDSDATIHPLARENCEDGIDNNCNGHVDDEEPDKDGDGFGVCAGDCNDNNVWISPGNVEDPTDEVDNNCNGVIDEPQVTCDCSGEPGMTIEEQAARAIGLCNEHQILGANFIGNPTGYGVYDDWAAIVPRISGDASSTDGWPQDNCKFLIMSSGQVKNPDPQSGEYMDLGIWGATDPAPTPDGAEVNDLTQFELQLRLL